MKTKQKLFRDGWGRVLAMLAAIGIGCSGLTVQAGWARGFAPGPRRLAAATRAATAEIPSAAGAVDPRSQYRWLRNVPLQTAALTRSVQAPSVRSRSVPSRPIPDRPAQERKTRARLPAHFGKLGVTLDQRATIYEIQGSYADPISALELKIRQLRDQQMQEVEDVLSAEQQLELKRFRAEAAKKQAERRQKSSKRRSNTERSNED